MPPAQIIEDPNPPNINTAGESARGRRRAWRARTRRRRAPDEH
eukprot:COSAG03_NODE_29068_length_190_cov_293.065934_1_plen_42_part_10